MNDYLWRGVWLACFHEIGRKVQEQPPLERNPSGDANVGIVPPHTGLRRDVNEAEQGDEMAVTFFA